MNKIHPLYIEDLDNAASVPEIERLYGKTFLITGSTGLIGTMLVDTLMRLNSKGAGITVIATGRSVERMNEHFRDYVSSSYFKCLCYDARTPFQDDLCADVIIPLASNTHPLAYSQFPIETVDINVKGAENALDKAAKCKATVLYPSSVEIYGNAHDDRPFSEDNTGALNLSTARACYPESKRISEALCLAYQAEKGVNVKIVRLSRVFGPTMLTSDTKASSQFIMNAVKGEDIVLKSEGKQFFSYTYVADVINAMLHVLLHGEQAVAYNVAVPSCNIHLREFASICAECAGKSVVFDVPSAAEKKGYSIAMNAVMEGKRLLSIGWESKYTIEDAITRTIVMLREMLT